MNRSLRIAIADDESDMQEYYRTILAEMGHVVVVVADTGRELAEKCREQHPDLVITDIKMPDMDGIDAAALIYKEGPIPVILVSAFNDSEYIERAESNHILSYLVKPIKQADLEPAIGIVMRRFEQFQEMRHEADDLKQALEDRKFVERAKGLIMKRASIDEATAFRRLQKMASDQGRKLVDIARLILTADQAFQIPDGDAPLEGKAKGSTPRKA